MGYLNYNLEKVAAAVEGEMEKQALSLGQLVGMGSKAVGSGKALHFLKRLDQRNRALINNAKSRHDQFLKAQSSALGDAAAMEKAVGKMGPNSKELARLQSRRIPGNNADATRWLSDTTPKYDSSDTINQLLRTKNAPMGSGDFTNIVNNLKNNWGHTFA